MPREPIFVTVRNDQNEIYGSYLFFYELVDLSNFSRCELSEVDPNRDVVYVFPTLNGNVEATCRAIYDQPRRCKLIIWQLEIPNIGAELTVPGYVDKMWVSDRHYRELVGDSRCQYVPIGGHPDFGWDSSKNEKKWDIVHMSYLYGKRAEQVATLEARGYSIAPTGFGDERNRIIAASRYGLCLHQHDVPILEPLRHTMFSCFNIPLIIEYCVDSYPYMGADFNEFLAIGERVFETERDWDQNYRLLTQELTFRKCVEEAL